MSILRYWNFQEEREKEEMSGSGFLFLIYKSGLIEDGESSRYLQE